jgi:hypothetical protein
VDAVGDGPVAFDPVGPFFASMRECDLRGQHVPAVLGVGVLRKRRGQVDADLAVGCDADRVVSVPLPGLAVSGKELTR